MDDRRAHFLTMLGDACASAGLATIPVEIVLSDGRRISGTPSPQIATDESQAVEDTGYSTQLLIDGGSVAIEDVVEFAVRTPQRRH